MMSRLGFLWACCAGGPLFAGPYSPSPESTGSVAIDAYEDAEMTLRNPELVAWANAFLNYLPGPNVSQTWQTPGGALGPTNDTGFHNSNTTTIVTLGDGGSITLSFATPILDTDGFDLVVFENGVTTTPGRGFFELAFVEVSSNGTDFYRFSGRSSTPRPTSPYAFLELSPTDLDGLAGKYPATYGTPFDFAWLGVTMVSHVRIVDIVGDGRTLDAEGRPIYDPYPTAESAGFDLDAVAAHVTARYSSWRKARFAWQDNFTTTSDPLTDADGIRFRYSSHRSVQPPAAKHFSPWTRDSISFLARSQQDRPSHCGRGFFGFAAVDRDCSFDQWPTLSNDPT